MKTREILDDYGNGGFISPEDLDKLRAAADRGTVTKIGEALNRQGRIDLFEKN